LEVKIRTKIQLNENIYFIFWIIYIFWKRLFCFFKTSSYNNLAQWVQKHQHKICIVLRYSKTRRCRQSTRSVVREASTNFRVLLIPVSTLALNHRNMKYQPTLCILRLKRRNVKKRGTVGAKAPHRYIN